METIALKTESDRLYTAASVKSPAFSKIKSDDLLNKDINDFINNQNKGK